MHIQVITVSSCTDGVVMFFGALVLASYASYVFLAETFSPFPPNRYNPAKSNSVAKKRRYLGYWSAFSILLAGIISSLLYPSASLFGLVVPTLAMYCLLMLLALFPFMFRRSKFISDKDRNDFHEV